MGVQQQSLSCPHNESLWRPIQLDKQSEEFLFQIQALVLACDVYGFAEITQSAYLEMKQWRRWVKSSQSDVSRQCGVAAFRLIPAALIVPVASLQRRFDARRR